jgi:hypothetical protein
VTLYCVHKFAPVLRGPPIICVALKASACPVTLSLTRTFIIFVTAKRLDSLVPALFRTPCSFLSPLNCAHRKIILHHGRKDGMDHRTALCSRSSRLRGCTCCSFVLCRALWFNEKWSTGAVPADDIHGSIDFPGYCQLIVGLTLHYTAVFSFLQKKH